MNTNGHGFLISRKPKRAHSYGQTLENGNSSFTIEAMNQRLQSVCNEVHDAIKNNRVLKLAKSVKNNKDHALYKSRNKYPDLPVFEIKESDLEQIEELNNFPIPLASGRRWTPLEKLFYALLWKDAKLKSIKLLVKGVHAALNGNREPPSSFVYYYLGRHLTDRLKEPLVDQHTMRACRLIWGTGNSGKFTVSDAERYRCEFLQICKSEGLATYDKIRLVDSLFHALGKYAKGQF